MCLKTVDRKKEPKVGLFGWKVFIKNPETGKIVSPYRDCTFPENRWVIADTRLLCAEDGTIYPSGFHLFKRKWDANKYAKDLRFRENVCIRRVRYKHVLATGTQRTINPASLLPTIVAAHVKLLPEKAD